MFLCGIVVKFSRTFSSLAQFLLYIVLSKTIDYG